MSYFHHLRFFYPFIVFYWWNLPLVVPIQIPKSFICGMTELGSLYWFYFQFQVLNSFIHFLPYVLVLILFLFFVFFWISFWGGFIHLFFKDLYHIHGGYFKVCFLCYSYWGSVVVEWLGSTQEILLLIVFVGWHLGIWVCKDLGAYFWICLCWIDVLSLSVFLNFLKFLWYLFIAW